jgi:alpha-glucoside transport system permease protein
MNRDKINKFFDKLPTHVIILLTIAIWIVPTLGLLITSFRPPQAVSNSGWWTVLSPPPGADAYAQYCASCHGASGSEIPEADLTNPDLVSQYPRSLQLLAMLREPINGQPHMGDIPLPSPQEAADITGYLETLAGIDDTQQFTFNNYIDALVGYRGRSSYAADCEAGTQPPDLTCTASDFLNPRGMGRAFLNSLFLTIPSHHPADPVRRLCRVCLSPGWISKGASCSLPCWSACR